MEYITSIILLFYLLLSAESDSLGSTSLKSNACDKFFDLVSHSNLPNYVVANISSLQAVEHTTIRKKAPLQHFPLTEQDLKDIKILEMKFENEKDCAGLAAPQIGISKRFIVFKVEKEESVEQAFPQSVWINPVYEKASDETELAYEQCFSVAGVTAPVKRYKYINYKATDTNGNLVQGKAEGWAARVIQHETDHLDGILFIDLVPPKNIITIEEFKRKLKKYEEEEDRKARGNKA